METSQSNKEIESLSSITITPSIEFKIPEGYNVVVKYDLQRFDKRKRKGKVVEIWKHFHNNTLSISCWANGKLHNENGPARIERYITRGNDRDRTLSVSIEFFNNGKMHNTNGPARQLIYPMHYMAGSRHWYIHGLHMPELENRNHPLTEDEIALYSLKALG
jgi:hypothetical protein